MLTIAFRNDSTGDKFTGNYDVTVTVNGLVIDRLRVEGHDRREGWRGLAKDLARVLEPSSDCCYMGKPCDCLKPVEWA